MNILEFLGFRRPKPVEKTQPQKRPKRPPKVTVHLVNGDRVIHYAGRRRLNEDGSLSLFAKWDKEKKMWTDEDIVADYATGTWTSITTGTRKVVKKQWKGTNMWTVRIWQPYEQDEIYEFNSLDEVKSFLTKRNFTSRSLLYHVELYPTPTPVNVYELMGIKE